MTIPYDLKFESSVILQGTKTIPQGSCTVHQFESSVILQGTKTTAPARYTSTLFESSVILQGTKTGLTEGFTGWWFESSVNEYAAKMLRKIRGVFVFRQEKPMLNLWFLPFALF